ncbi:MAG: outer membrane protein assembly factor BamB family protein [Planctomycetota bacterium]
MREQSIFAIVIGILLNTQVLAADWPQWRGPGRDGVWREEGIVRKLEQIWSHAYGCKYQKVGYPDGPRAAVTLNDGRAYSLGTMGHLFCFDAAKGDVLWKKDLKAEYNVKIPIWGIAAAPLVENGLLILHIGGENACLIALDKVTGAEKWRALDDRASYSAPIIIQQAGRRVLVCWTGDSVSGLDPLTGELHWQHPFKPARMVINIATPVFENCRRESLAAHREKRKRYRQLALLHIDSHHSGGLHLRRGQLRRASLPRPAHRRPHLGKPRSRTQRPVVQYSHGAA